MLNTISLLLAPSLFSLVVTAGLVVILSASTLIKYGLNTKTLYDLILGVGSSPDLINNTQGTFAMFYDTIFGNSTLNKILFFVFWMLIGLIVYGFIIALSHQVEEADDAIHELGYAHINKAAFWRQHLTKFGIHMVVISVIAVYTVFFWKLLLPFSLLSIQIGAATLPALTAFGYGLLGLIVLSLGLHFYVILLRLLTLRIRVFGGND